MYDMTWFQLLMVMAPLVVAYSTWCKSYRPSLLLPQLQLIVPWALISNVLGSSLSIYLLSSRSEGPIVSHD